LHTIGNEERLLGALTITERRTLDALSRALLIQLERRDAAS
jgi:hypothetical protein